MLPDWMEGTDIAFPNLGIYLQNVPQSFTVFGFRITFYGVIIGIGVILAFLLIDRMAKKNGLDPDDFYDLGIYVLIFGIIGARLYYVIFSWDMYKNDLLSIFNTRQGGLAIYGGVIAGFLTLIIYCKIKKKSMAALGDVAVMGLLVGQIVGRWGNFTNREVFGKYTDNLFAMRLPESAVRSADITADIREHMIPGTNYIQVHPTFLYESFANLVLLILILVFQKKKKFDGEIALWYLSGYGLIRFFVEGIRTDQLMIWHTTIPVSQLLGGYLFIAAMLAIIVLRIQKSKNVVKAKS
ncbi:MAG TPA: prolipoprotein diacylglyceryl transferase [Lachnospiraceae bacterium]|nr:prolipoprotein diacylglyceryl transferase [Lachnospiraceae bacterium]